MVKYRRRLSNRRSANQQGQGLVEFALVIGVLVFAIVLGMEAIMLIIQWQTIHQVADFGVREAAKDGGASIRVESELQAQMIARNVDPATVSVDIYAVTIESDGTITQNTPVTDSCDYGGDIAVELRQPWHGLILGGLVSGQEFVARHTFECWRGRIAP